MPGKNTRASTGGIDPYVMFPVMEAFLPSNQLPTHKSVIGVLRHLTSGGARQHKPQGGSEGGGEVSVV